MHACRRQLPVSRVANQASFLDLPTEETAAYGSRQPQHSRLASAFADILHEEAAPTFDFPGMFRFLGMLTLTVYFIDTV